MLEPNDEMSRRIHAQNNLGTLAGTCSNMFLSPIPSKIGETNAHQEGTNIEVAVMSDIAAVIRQFPMQELAIRRLYRRVPEFRTLCEDYTTARCALERWRADEQKARDFQLLIEEIGAEIEEAIHGALAVLRQDDRETEA